MKKLLNRGPAYDCIQNAVNMLTVDEEYKPIIKEIMLRRQCQFELTDRQVFRDCNRLVRNLKSISLKNIANTNVSGYYIPENCPEGLANSIELSQQYIKRNKNTPKGQLDIFDTIAHEVTHALCKDEKKNDILGSYYDENDGQVCRFNRYSGQFNNTLLELVVARVGNVLSYGNVRNAKNPFTKSVNSYFYTSEVLEILEATYGVKEKDILKVAITSGRAGMATLFSQQTGDSIQDSLAQLDRFEVSYNTLHNSVYNKQNLQNKEMQKNNIRATVRAIHDFSTEILNKRIEKCDFKDRQTGNLAIERFKYDYNKVNVAINELAIKLGKKAKIPSYFFEVSDDVNRNRSNIKTKLSKISAFLNYPHIRSEERKKLIQKAKRAPINRPIKDDNVFFEEIDYNVINEYNDTDFKEEWDNTKLENDIKECAKKQIKKYNKQRRKDIVKKFFNTITRKNKKQLKLPQPPSDKKKSVLGVNNNPFESLSQEEQETAWKSAIEKTEHLAKKDESVIKRDDNNIEF